MNKDQIKGRIKKAAGEVQEHMGRVVGNKTQEAKGHAREFAGKLQKTAGDARENLKDASSATKSKVSRGQWHKDATKDVSKR